MSTAAAQRFADEHNMLLFETSALSDAEFETVESIFYTLALCLRRCAAAPRTVSLGTSAYSVPSDASGNVGREGVIQLCSRRGSYSAGGSQPASGTEVDDDEYGL